MEVANAKRYPCSALSDAINLSLTDEPKPKIDRTEREREEMTHTYRETARQRYADGDGEAARSIEAIRRLSRR